MGDEIPMGTNRLREMFEKAQGQVFKDNYRERPKIKWRITVCPHCGYKIRYYPKEEWMGTLKCPECGIRFKVPSLDGFVKDEAKEEIYKV